MVTNRIPNPKDKVRFLAVPPRGVRWGGAVLRKYRATSPILVLSTMTKTQIVLVTQNYARIIEAAYRTNACTRLDESKAALHIAYIETDVAAHLRWMCDEIGRLLIADKVEKAMRWLGFIQGAMWRSGLRTIEQLKQDNMPPDEKFDGARV